MWIRVLSRIFKARFHRFDRTQTYTCAPFTQGIPHLPLFVFALSALNGPRFWIERISQRTGQRNRQRTPRLLLSEGLAVDVTQTQSRVCGSGIWFKIPTVHDKPARLTKCVPAHLLWKMQEAKRKKCVDRWDGIPLILLWIFASVGGLISSNLIFLEKCHGFFFSHFSKFRGSL